MFAKGVDDPQVLELLQKCFARIKTAKQITAISHENRAQNWEKKPATTIKSRKLNNNRKKVCLVSWKFYLTCRDQK